MQTQNTLNEREAESLWERIPVYWQKCTLLIFQLFPKIPIAFHHALEKGNNQTFRDYRTLTLTWHWFQEIQHITLVHQSEWVLMEVSDQWNFSLGLSHSGASRSSNWPFHYLPSCECIIGIYIHYGWQNSHIGSLISGVRTTTVRKAKWKPQKLHLSRSIENQKGYFFPPGEITEINATISDVKDTGVVIPITSPSHILMWPLQKIDGSWRMIVDYQKLRQVVTTTAAALSDVSLSSRLTPGTCYNQAERWNNEIKRCLLLGRKAMAKLDSTLKSRDITLPTKAHIVKATAFLVVIYQWELDHKESWGPKNWCFQIAWLEKTLESSLGFKEIKPVNPKGNQPWIFIVRTYAKAETLILWPPDVKRKRPWCWERSKANKGGGSTGRDG